MTTEIPLKLKYRQQVAKGQRSAASASGTRKVKASGGTSRSSAAPAGQQARVMVVLPSGKKVMRPYR